MYKSSREIKLTYELWLEEWKKRHCEACLIGLPVPANCYLCPRERKIGFNCAICSHFVYYSETQSVAGGQTQICGGFYETGSCFCANCQGIIKKHLKDRGCACEFSLAGYSAGHPIHNYRLTINGLVKPFFKGSKLWIKLVCRSCEKVIGSFKLNCSCYLEQKKHQHLYSKKRCLSCAVGDYVRPLAEWDLRQKYRQYCQDWQERAEVHAQLSIKQQYKYDGESYWAKCSFCPGEIRGKAKDKEPLSRNKVSFWMEKRGVNNSELSQNEADERIICNGCLRKKKVLKGLEIKGVKRQMLYNYRLRRII